MMEIFGNLSIVQLFIPVKDEETEGHASKISQMRKFLSLTLLADCSVETMKKP